MDYAPEGATDLARERRDMLDALKGGNAPSHKEFTSAIAHIAPGTEKSVALGSYLKSEPSPAFDLDVEDGMLHLISATLERQDIRGTARYVMFYQLHNNGDKMCRVTVRRRADRVTT